MSLAPKAAIRLELIDMKTSTKIIAVVALALAGVAATVKISVLPPRTTMDTVDDFPFTHYADMTTYRITASNFIWNAMGFWATNDLARTNWVSQLVYQAATNQIRINSGADIRQETNAVGPLLFYTIHAGTKVLTNGTAYSAVTNWDEPALTILARTGQTNDILRIKKANGDPGVVVSSNSLVRIRPYNTDVNDPAMALHVDGGIRASTNVTTPIIDSDHHLANTTVWPIGSVAVVTGYDGTRNEVIGSPLVDTNELNLLNGLTSAIATENYVNTAFSAVGEHFYFYGSLTNFPMASFLPTTNTYFAFPSPSAGVVVTNLKTLTASDEYFAAYISSNSYQAVQGGAATVEAYCFETGAGSSSYHAEFYLWDDTNLVEIGSSPDQVIPSSLAVQLFSVNVASTNTPWPVKFVIRYKSASVLLNPVIRIVTEGVYDSHMSFPVPASGTATTNYVQTALQNYVLKNAGYATNLTVRTNLTVDGNLTTALTNTSKAVVVTDLTGNASQLTMRETNGVHGIILEVQKQLGANFTVFCPTNATGATNMLVGTNEIGAYTQTGTNAPYTITTNNAYYGLQAVVDNTYQPPQMPVLLTNIVDLSRGWQRIQYTNTGNIYMPHSTNRPAAEDQVRSSTWIVNTGITNRNFAFNASWVWLGTNAPVLVASNKVVVFNFSGWGAYETNVIATWSVQP